MNCSIKKLMLTLTIVAMLMTPHIVLANEDANETIVARPKQEISLYYSVILAKDGDPGALFKEKIEKINSMAKKHNWQNFKLTQKSLSLEYGYGRNMTASISLSVELDQNYTAITQLFQESDADSVGVYFQN